MSGFCRDCLKSAPDGARRCPACSSPRVLFHDELDDLSLVHLDCDAFFAAVEKRDNPALTDRPVIIGGGRRGVVATACYVARIKGVHSAQPMFKALAACPDAVVIKPDIAKYSRVSRQVRDLMRELTPLVEPLSIDEAFLDLSGTVRLHGRCPARSAAFLANRIEREIGITVSIGLGPNKFLAKLGSDHDKPRGFFVIGKAEALDFLADKPVTMIWGVGKAFQRKLNKDGLRTIGQLRTIDKTELIKRYGVIGARLYDLARGQDSRAVNPRVLAKSISSETTFDADILDFQVLCKVLWRLCEKVSRRCKQAGYAGRSVTLKLKTSDFQSLTRTRKLAHPTQMAEVIFRQGMALLQKETTTGTRYRLIGVGLGSLVDGDLADPLDLLDPDSGKRAEVERVMDKVRDKFGAGVIGKGRGL